MKIHDFDAKFYDYVLTWMAMHPGMTEKQVEESYNEIMLNWLNAPASWLNGEKPGEYFMRYSDPKDLLKLVTEYDKRGLGLPEPLYSRVVNVGTPCVESLIRIVRNYDNPESLRATSLAILRDIGDVAAQPLMIDLICQGDEADDVSEMAVDALCDGVEKDLVDKLMARYDDATEFGQMRILDICSNFPGDERIYERLMEKLRNRPDERAYYASLLGKLGDARAVDTLKSFLELQDLSYLDYIEIRNAVEELGGDPGEERTFYGDPNYEAMRNM